MNIVSAWTHATRPKTLAAAAAPVFMGAAISFKNNTFDQTASGVALLCAFLIQIGTNFANDYFDFKKGADNHERLGFQRAVSAGWISPQAMFRATILIMSLAFVCGLFLVYKGGWPVLLLGICSILAGIAYTGGPYPLGYNGLGDLFVMLFFGQAAVMGTVFVNGLEWTAESFWWSLAPGALSVNILVVNNLRDIETDRKVGKRTLGVFFGERALRLEYLSMVLLAGIIPAVFALTTENHVLLLASALAVFGGFHLLQAIERVADKRELNPLLEKTARLLAVYGLIAAAAIAGGS